MINKETKMLTLVIILLNAATVSGYVLATKPVQDQCMPYIKPETKLETHVWARDQALTYLRIDPMFGWAESDITPEDVLGTTVYLYESGDISVRVSHNLNPTADFFVDVHYLDQSWSLRVSQAGDVIPA